MNIIRRKILPAAVCAALALGTGSAMADELSDLKAEIQAQRAMMDAQKARLESLERKLEAVTSAPPPAVTPSATTASIQGGFGAPGEGYAFHITPQDQVSVYGLLDLTTIARDHANASGSRSYNMEIGWFSGSRWGISGLHDLGHDRGRAIFKLESEYEIPTGNEDTPGTLFNRDAWLGYESDSFGKLTLGRQNALPRDFSGIYGDPYTNAKVTTEEGGYTNSNNFKQLIYYAASATGTRYDRGIVWKKDFGGFVAGAAYQFGGVAGNNEEGASEAIALGYNGAGDVFHLAGYYTQFQVGGFDHKDWSVGGNVAFGPMFRVYAGWYKDDTQQPAPFAKRDDHAWTLSTRITPQGPTDFELGYQILHAEHAGTNAAGNVINPYANSATIKGTATGDKKTLYGSIFYHFDRRFEVYVTADYAKLTGGYKVGSFNGFNSQTEIGLGSRFRF
jgi:predicted porin